MRPAAHIVHRARGRIRLRIPERRKDLLWFIQLYEHLRRLPGVAEVQANPITGSALLRVEDGRDDQVARALAGSPLFALENDAPEPAFAAVGIALRAAQGADRQLRELSGGVLDLHSLAVLLSLGLTLKRPLTGALLTSALSLLWLPGVAEGADDPSAADTFRPT